MSNNKISEPTQNYSKSNISELTDSDLAGIQGGSRLRDMRGLLAAFFGKFR
jgi:hypothetical protein